jgi:hypothetical protein
MVDIILQMAEMGAEVGQSFRKKTLKKLLKFFKMKIIYSILIKLAKNIIYLRMSLVLLTGESVGPKKI